MKGMGGDEYAFQGIYFGVIRANANITNSSRIKSRTATKIQNDRKIRVPTVFLVFVLWWFFFFFFALSCGRWQKNAVQCRLKTGVTTALNASAFQIKCES